MSAFKTITSDNATITTNLTFPNRLTINNMPTGSPNQFLQTNGSGIPVYGAGGGGQAPGSNEQSLWTIGGVTSWQNRSFRYNYLYTNFTNGEDWNTNPQLNITFGSIQSQSSSFGPNAYSALTVQTPNTTFLCNTSGFYMVSFFACLNNTGLTTSKVRFNLVLNGFITITGGPSITIAAGQEGCISANITIGLAAGNTLQFTSTSELGTSPLICDGPNSKLTIQLMSTLV